ncbi:hypothetical protein ACWEK5_45400 [Rhodococcus koreensis]
MKSVVSRNPATTTGKGTSALGAAQMHSSRSIGLAIQIAANLPLSQTTSSTTDITLMSNRLAGVGQPLWTDISYSKGMS